MNCFEFRRLILANPRERTRELEAHMAQCTSCNELAREVENFEGRIQEAVLVPVPEALAERVLLRQELRGRSRYRAWALAASLVAALGLGIYFYPFIVGEEPVQVASSLGTSHPAVKAIVHVRQDEPRMLEQSRGVDPVAVRAAFTRRGLNVPGGGTTVVYFDKCPMTGGAGEHVVLQTPFGQVTLILMPYQTFASRLVVADRDKAAILALARAGGSYILVADSPIKARQAEKTLL